MTLGLLIGVCCMVIFFRAADYERMNPWVWALASVGITAVVSTGSAGLFRLLFAQMALFGVMWWYNIKRHQKKTP